MYPAYTAAAPAVPPDSATVLVAWVNAPTLKFCPTVIVSATVAVSVPSPALVVAVPRTVNAKAFVESVPPFRISRLEQRYQRC